MNVALNDRSRSIGASDAKRVINAPRELWLEKTGRERPADLSGIFCVQLGLVTEKLNLDWYERVTGNRVTMRQEQVWHPEMSWCRATLDGYDASRKAVIDAKHTNPNSRRDGLIAEYSPQLQHQMLIMGIDHAILSVIVGSSEPILIQVDRDDWWIDDYVDLLKRFWECVITDTPPSWKASIGQPNTDEKTAIINVEDTDQSEEWKLHAAKWLDNKLSAEKFTQAREALKSMIPGDAKQAYGHGVTVNRSIDNKISIRRA